MLLTPLIWSSNRIGWYRVNIVDFENKIKISQHFSLCYEIFNILSFLKSTIATPTTIHPQKYFIYLNFKKCIYFSFWSRLLRFQYFTVIITYRNFIGLKRYKQKRKLAVLYCHQTLEYDGNIGLLFEIHKEMSEYTILDTYRKTPESLSFKDKRAAQVMKICICTLLSDNRMECFLLFSILVVCCNVLKLFYMYLCHLLLLNSWTLVIHLFFIHSSVSSIRDYTFNTAT